MYLSWLRKQKCVVSGELAQVAHHVRLGTNGGKGIKPSDYFCIPLLNEYHTHGTHALHIIGEESFFRIFRLDKIKLFKDQLEGFLLEQFKVKIDISALNSQLAITRLIEEIEKQRPAQEKNRLNKPKAIKEKPLGPKVKITDSEFYQKAKEKKKVYDKKLREQMKGSRPFNNIEKKDSYNKVIKNKKKVSITDTEFYQKAKEEKKAHDKKLREQMKESRPLRNREKKDSYHKVIKNKKKASITDTEFYQKAKEARKVYEKEQRNFLKSKTRAKGLESIEESDTYIKLKKEKALKEKALRDQLKKKQSEYRKEQYRRLKKEREL